MERKTALTVAGSDSSGGAGIQADLKTFLALGVYGMSAVTALTAQNTCGVTAIMTVTPEFLAAQLDAVYEDIPPEAVKVGMCASEALIRTMAERFRFYKSERLVVDPVMVATSGARLIEETAVQALTEELFPLASLITPNLPEAELLLGAPIRGAAAMEKAAKELWSRYGAPVLLKGGHDETRADDYLYRGAEGGEWLFGERIATENTHGTGCTLSSAIAANLAKGAALGEAVIRAKAYVRGALLSGLSLGKGSGPLDHGWNLEEKQ